MKKENDFTGIGRMYQGSEFLAEVLYRLRCGKHSTYFSDDIRGHIMVMEGTHALPLNAPKILRLEDGRLLQITLQDGDSRVGKYIVQGVGYIQ